MTNREVIDTISKDKAVEKVIWKITTSATTDSLHDLAQDIYLQLLTDERTVGMYERGELNYWISRVAMNNIASSTSPYYRTYIMPEQASEELPIDDAD